MIGHEDKKKSMLIGMAGQYSGHAVRKASKQKKGIGAVRGGKNSAASLRGGTGSSSASASSPSLAIAATFKRIEHEHAARHFQLKSNQLVRSHF